MDIDAICPLVSVWRAFSTFITKALIFILMVSKYEAIKLISWFYSNTRALYLKLEHGSHPWAHKKLKKGNRNKMGYL